MLSWETGRDADGVHWWLEMGIWGAISDEKVVLAMLTFLEIQKNLVHVYLNDQDHFLVEKEGKTANKVNIMEPYIYIVDNVTKLR